jgi:hypothetical protein
MSNAIKFRKIHWIFTGQHHGLDVWLMYCTLPEVSSVSA